MIKLFFKIFAYIIYKFKTVNYINIADTKLISKKTTIHSAHIFGNVEIGVGCKIIDGVKLIGSSKIKIGRFTSINGPFTDIQAQVFPVIIGSFTSIARGVNIQEYNHNYRSLSTYSIHQNLFGKKKSEDIYSVGSIKIGNDVWIGAQVVILSGAIIGDGAIIGSNSVVHGIIPPYSIAFGSPAKVHKYRFDELIIQQLQRIKWWEWPKEKIIANHSLFKDNLSMRNLNEIK